MNISAAASTLGVTPDMLRKWDERLPLNIPRDPAGRRRFDDRSLQLLRLVKQLSDQGRSFDTITAVLDRPSADVLTQAPVGVQPEPAERSWYRASLHAASAAAASRAEALLTALGDAQRERHLLEREVHNLRKRIADLARTNDDLAARLANAAERLERAELMSAVRQDARPRPWWQFWRYGEAFQASRRSP